MSSSHNCISRHNWCCNIHIYEWFQKIYFSAKIVIKVLISVSFHELNVVCHFEVTFCPPLFQIWIYGNSFEPFLVAIVNPRQQALELWAQENGITVDFNSLCEDSKAKSYIIGELAKIGKEKKVLFSLSFLILPWFVILYSIYSTWWIWEFILKSKVGLRVSIIHIMLIKFHINLEFYYTRKLGIIYN